MKLDLKKLNLSIAQKLAYGFGIVFIFLLLNAIVTIFFHVYSKSIQDEETDLYNPVKRQVEEIRNLITESKRLTVNWVYVDHQSDTPEKVRLASIVNNEYDSVYSLVEAKTADWEVSFTDTLKMVDEKVHEYFDYQRTVMNNLSSFESYDDVMLMMEAEMLVQSDGDMMYVEEELNQLMDTLVRICDGKCGDIRDSINLFSTIQLVFLIVMSIILMAVLIGVAFLLLSTIVEPLKKCVEFAEAIGNGNLNATVEIEQSDEIGKLVVALVQMEQNLKNIVVTIDKNANDLVDSGESLNSNSMKLSKGASEQAASAEEVSTAIEEMVANIDQNTENAISTEKITSSTAENVMLSSQYSNEAAEAMNLISQKITIISDIAFQTNILALNAAVEAVRAGEHGRGFSVVAAEVRKLAEHSKQAASEIVSLVNKGMKVSQMAGEKAKALVPDIEKTTVLIKEISAASIEQKTGAEQINLAMQNLNVITQENASSSDELNGSAVQLNKLAANLKEAVSFFKLDEAEEVEKPQGGAEIKLDDDESEETESEPESPKFHKSERKGASIDIGNFANDGDLDNYEKF